MAKLKNKQVLITGAGNGIGRCMVDLFAKSGSRLILADIDQAALKTVEQEMKEQGTTVTTHAVDIADRDSVNAMVEKVQEETGGLDILINNAGIGHNGELVETPIDTWKKLMDVNFWGPLYTTYGFLPHFIRAGKGHIVNVSSGQAFFRLPTWGPYSIIKLALGGFSELLRLETKKFGLKVTTVYPFMVDTGFYSEIQGETFFSRLSMKLVPYYSMSPERVAKIIFKAVKKQKSVEMVSILNDVGYVTRFVSPVSNAVSSATLYFMGKKPEVLRQEQNI